MGRTMFGNFQIAEKPVVDCAVPGRQADFSHSFVRKKGTSVSGRVCGIRTLDLVSFCGKHCMANILTVFE